MTKRILFIVIVFVSVLTLTSCEQMNYTISDCSVKGDHISSYLEYNMLKRQSKDNVVIDLTYNEDNIYSIYNELFYEFSMKYYDNDWFEAGKYVENMPARYCLYVYNPEIRPVIYPEKEHPLFPFVDKKIEYVNTHYEEGVNLSKELFIKTGEKILIETRLCTTLHILNGFKKTTIVEIYYKIDGNEILFSKEPFDK